MRKTLTILGLILIILVGLSQLLLPPIAEKTLESRLAAALKTDRITAQVSGIPALFLLFGHIGHVDLSAEDAMLGEVRAARVVLSGDGVNMPLDRLTQGEFVVTRADRLRIDARVTAEDLADFLQRKVDKVQNVTVEITPELVLMNGQAKIFGQMADIHIEGKVLEENNSLWFRMTRLDIKNALLGRALTGNFFGDIELVDFQRLHLPVELDTVRQGEGEVILSASRHAAP